ncbi:MAG TPA: hypothetical protein VJU80_01095 [Solirubrobacteraceae bacterium]|nr:hypothetical protein [Solirubrobacteraceae bacterium]
MNPTSKTTFVSKIRHAFRDIYRAPEAAIRLDQERFDREIELSRRRLHG